MTRFSRSRGMDLFSVTRRTENPRIYLPSLAVPERRKTLRNFKEDVKLVMKNAAHPPQPILGRRGHYPCRGIDLKTALYDCNERHLYIGIPCEELYITGTNLITDPGFENESSAQGPGGEDFPIYRGACYWDQSTSAFATQVPSSLGWAEETNAGSGWAPLYSTADPRSGSRHIRVPDPAKQQYQNGMLPLPMKLCTLKHNGNYRTVTGRVNPGDTVSISCYMKTVTGSDQVIKSDLVIEYFTSTLSFIGQEWVQTTLTDAYVQYSLSDTAPTDVYYFTVRFRWAATSAPPFSVSSPVDVDDCSVIVT